MRRWYLFGRCVTGLMIFFVVLELSARVDDALTYGASFWRTYSRDVLITRDAIGRRGRPGARYQKWRLNSLGYRGPELQPSTIRLVCFGASETFGLYEAEGQEYPRQLERELNSRAGKDVFQVVNVAVVGETIATATLRVPEVVDQIHPSYAIIYPSVATYIWLPWVGEAPVSESPRKANLPQTRQKFQLRITERIHNLLKQALPSVIQTKLRQLEIEKDIAQNHYPVMERVPEENVLRFRKDLLRLVGSLRARDVEPLLVTHATLFGKQLSESDRDMLVAWRKSGPMLREEGFLDMERRMNAAIRKVASEEHVVLIDAAEKIPPGREYFGDFVHFTSTGARIMACCLADGLQPLIEARSRLRTSVLSPSRAALDDQD